MCSFVLSRLDYCNATLAGLPAANIARLQRIQNNAAWLVLQKSKRQHVTPLLNNTGFRFKHALTTNLQHLLFDTLMVLCLSISLQGWIYISRPNRSDQAMTGFSGFHVGNWNLSGTGFSATKDLSFGTLFPLISNSHLPCPPLNPDWKHFCSRSPIHYAEITVTDVSGHATMIKTM